MEYRNHGTGEIPEADFQELQDLQWKALRESGYIDLIAFNAHRFTGMQEKDIEKIYSDPIVILGSEYEGIKLVYLGIQESYVDSEKRRHFRTRLIPVGKRTADGVVPQFDKGYNKKDFLFFEGMYDVSKEFVETNDIHYNMETGAY